MTFFYDLNKRLAQLADKQDAQQLSEDAKAVAPKSKLAQALNERDLGKHNNATTGFDALAKKAGKEYGSKAAGERVAGAVKAKMAKAGKLEELSPATIQSAAAKRDAQTPDQMSPATQRKDIITHLSNRVKMNNRPGVTDEGNAFTGALAKTPKGGKFKVGGKEFTDTSSLEESHCPACDCSPCECDSMEESALQGYLGKKKYGDKGMKALQKAGREHAGKAKMDQIRNRYDKMDEGDMEEGNAFTGALAKTPKGGKFKVGGKEFTDTSSIEEGFKEMDAWLASREKEKGTGKFDKKERTLPGGMKATTYTRKHDDDEEDDDKDAPEAKGGAPKKKGRPKGKDKGPERVTAKSYKYKTVDGKRVKKEKTKEGLDSDGVMMTRPSNMSSESVSPAEQGEYNDEAGMTKDSLHTIMRHARELEKCLRQNENLPEWVQEKVGQIKGMMTSVTDYILSTHERDAEQHMGREGITIEPMAEKAVSKNQAVAARIARGVQKGEVKARPGSASATMAKMAPGELKKFAKTPTKGLPKHVDEESTDKEDQRAEKAGRKVAKDIEHDEGHRGRDDNRAERAGKKVTKDIEYDDKKDRKEKKEEKVDETTVAGSVAPAQNAAPKVTKGMQFGKGVYESYNQQFTTALNESISIESKMEECGDGEMAPTLTIQADGEEATKLMMLLKLAGLESQIPKACPSCGASPCGCDEMVDENAPDWPTNTEKLDADPNLRTYSGGLNGPKSTGQSTVPVLASQLRRQASMEESAELERNLFKTWQNYKG
jgi:hypothetical protein